jgi:hypothetical protein
VGASGDVNNNHNHNNNGGDQKPAAAAPADDSDDEDLPLYKEGKALLAALEPILLGPLREIEARKAAAAQKMCVGVLCWVMLLVLMRGWWRGIVWPWVGGCVGVLRRKRGVGDGGA